MQALGVDVGGSGIKAAPVDAVSGELLAERLRIATPRPATPQAVASVIAELAGQFDWRGPVGCAVPVPVRDGIALAAANVDKSWVGTDMRATVGAATGLPVTLLNDADAAGAAEMRFGAGRGRAGVVLIVTLGTGIGTALFNDGRLVPNTELGHIEIDGRDAEELASDRARKRDDLNWKAWAGQLDRYLTRLEFYLRPSLIVIGGGISKKADKYLPRLTLSTPVVAAELQNQAGIVGAALAALAAD